MRDAAFEATLYDGQTARQHKVLVTPTADALEMRFADGRQESLPLALLKRGQHLGGALAVQRTDLPGWRLLVPDPGRHAWLDGLAGADSLIAWARQVGWVKVVGGATVSIAAAVLIGMNIVDIGVRLLPQSVSREIGERIVGEFAYKNSCVSIDADRALNGLARRMYPTGLGLAEPLTVKVVNIDVENAFATPGGYVVVFNGLIQKAKSPDELAAVIAHEFGHVHHRHPERALVRAFGIGLFLGGAGGDTGAMVDAMLTLSNSRDYEREADAEGLAALDRVNISPAGMAAFFERVDGEARKAQEAAEAKTGAELDGFFDVVGDWFSTHPDSSARAAAARKRVEAGRAYAPALTAQQWAAVKTMCDTIAGRDDSWLPDSPDPSR